MQRLTLPILGLLSMTPAMALEEAALCRRLTDLAAQANKQKGGSIDRLSSNQGVALSCAKRTVVFYKAIALSFSEINPTWHTAMQRNWNSIYCGNQTWAEMIANGWKVSSTWVTGDGKRITFEAQCREMAATHTGAMSGLSFNELRTVTRVVRAPDARSKTGIE